MVQYKLTPVKKPFSNKIKYEDGTPEKVFRFSTELGMLSREELELLVKLKSGEKIPDTARIKILIRELLKKRIIEKVD
ncbi:MAG: hypothetical protein ACFFAS_13760 [Promethearchaeota archaeon]